MNRRLIASTAVLIFACALTACRSLPGSKDNAPEPEVAESSFIGASEMVRRTDVARLRVDPKDASPNVAETVSAPSTPNAEAPAAAESTPKPPDDGKADAPVEDDWPALEPANPEPAASAKEPASPPAQTAPAAEPGTATARVEATGGSASRAKQTTDYRLRVGDSIEVTVFDEPQMTRQLDILPDGKISYLLVGEIPAAGLSLPELREALTTHLRTYFVDPIVNVIPVKLAAATSDFVSVRGAVARPGWFQVRRNMTVIEVLAQAGGLTSAPDGTYVANLKKSRLLRQGRDAKLDLAALLQRGDMKHNVVIQDGDILEFPSEHKADVKWTINVLGGFNSTGRLTIQGDTRVLDVLTQTGGTTANADLTRAYIYREGRYIDLDMSGILEGRDMTHNIRIYDGDFLYLPQTQTATVTVVGAVQTAGRHVVQEGSFVLDVIAEAGGLLFTPDFVNDVLANLGAAYMIRDNAVLDVDFDALLRKGDMTQNLKVKDGDFIYIPEAGQEQIFVLGEIETPGVVPLIRETHLIELIAQLGDLTLVGKDKGQATIIRGDMRDPEVIQLGLKGLYKGDLTNNILLQDGDIVYIQELRVAKFLRFADYVTALTGFWGSMFDFRQRVKVDLHLE